MNEILFFIPDYLRGKSIYGSVRRLLDFIFLLSITSFAYELLYGPYEWLDLTDYRVILDFFLKGRFFIPISIFFIVQFITWAIPAIISLLFLRQITSKIARVLILIKFRNESIEEGMEGFVKWLKKIYYKSFSKSDLIRGYNELRVEMKPDEINNFKKELNEPKRIIEAHFIVTFRMLLAISIYFSILPDFGIGLFICVCVLLVLFLFVFLILLRVFDLLPIIIKKLYTIAESHLVLQPHAIDTTNPNVLENS